jgi:hypothetical protein
VIITLIPGQWDLSIFADKSPILIQNFKKWNLSLIQNDQEYSFFRKHQKFYFNVFLRHYFRKNYISFTKPKSSFITYTLLILSLQTRPFPLNPNTLFHLSENLIIQLGQLPKLSGLIFFDVSLFDLPTYVHSFISRVARMLIFKQNPDFGKFWRVLQWKMLA